MMVTEPGSPAQGNCPLTPVTSKGGLEPPSRREHVLVALLSLLATYLLFFEYLPPFKRVHLWSDVAGYHYPLQRYAFQSLKEGHIPKWDPSIYCGITFAGNVQAALWYPPTWLMYAATWTEPRIKFKTMEVFTFLHVWWAYFLTYLWLRGRSGKLPSALGAAVFAWTGYMMYQTLHTGVICAMTWLPLALWGVDDWAERGNWRALWKVAAASALAFLAGYPAAWIVNCAITGAYAVASRIHWRAAAGACLAMAASVALIAVQLLPAIEARSLMVLEPKYGAGAYSALSLLRSYLLPNWFDFNPVHATDFDPGCVYLYVGMPALFALGWAIWRHSPRSYGQPVFGLAVALFLANPPHFLLMAVERIPALRFTMQPHNYLAATGAMVALITAIGLDDFLKSGAARNWPGWVPWTGGCAIAAWAVRDLVIWHRGSVFPTGSAAIAPAATGVALFSFGLWCVRCSIGWRRALLAGIVLFGTAADYKVYGSGRWFNAVSGDVDDEFTDYGIRGIDDAGYRAMSENRQYRVFTDDGIGPHPTDYRMWGLATPEGFDPFLSTAYKRTIQHWVPFRTNRLFDVDDHNDEMMQALGVRYAVVRDGTSHDAFLAASPSFRRLGRVDVFCHVYEYLRAKPPFHWEAERSGVAEPSGWVPEQRDFRVRSATGGRFVLVEQFSPGWRATVDGRPAAVERWDGVFQAVRVPPGAHRVRFEFRPACIAAGAAVSLIALAALLTLMRADYRARRAMTIARAA